MPALHVLAWDLGTSGAKAGIVAASGEVLASEFEPTELLLFDGGGAEQSPEGWWSALGRATERLLAREVVPRASIAALGVTGQWSGTVPVGADGAPLGNAILWMDSRGAGAVRRLMGGPIRVSGYSPLQLWRWVRLTGGAPAHSGKDSLAHILYLKEAHPELYARTHKFLEPKDYLTFRLSGRMAATFDSIALHWLTDNRDPRRIRYAPELVRRSGVDAEKLPELCAATEVLGPLLPEHCTRFGLPAGTPVVAGTPDVHAAAIGAGTTENGAPHLYIGTSSWIASHVPAKQTSVLYNMASLPAAIPNRYLLINEQETAGACLVHLRDKLFFADDALGTRAPADAFRAFDAAAATSPPGSRGLVFLPWLYGERTPVEDKSLRATLFHYSLDHSRADVIRAVLEGVALNTRWLFGAVEGFLGNRVDEIRLIGGGGESELWSRIFADALGRTILCVDEPRSANLRGAAFVALVGLGELDFAEIPERVKVRRRVEPDPANRAVYDERYREFHALYRALRPIFARRSR